MAAGLQQGQHQRGEFVAHRDAGEADAGSFAPTADGERRLASIAAIVAHADLGRERGDVGQQFAHLARGIAGIERCDEFDGGLELIEVGGKLGLDGGVEHDGSPGSGVSELQFHQSGRAKRAIQSPPP